MRSQLKSKTQTRKPFQWGISSTTINFMKPSELEAVRDGSANDCSKVSPLPQPKRKPARRSRAA
ncbi:hypothetical protein GCM10027034_16340 [Ramlibacter solisilvae]|uniref:hypothetical protein n=1 Tax=Ramlibacter tataouinensis TaxID=94132 RepID=UPI0011AE42CC|nr:hypothetical protein [Ramlibacter tataouinensis]